MALVLVCLSEEQHQGDSGRDVASELQILWRELARLLSSFVLPWIVCVESKIIQGYWCKAEWPVTEWPILRSRVLWVSHVFRFFQFVDFISTYLFYVLGPQCGDCHIRGVRPTASWLGFCWGTPCAGGTNLKLGVGADSVSQWEGPNIILVLPYSHVVCAPKTSGYAMALVTSEHV